MYHTLKPWARRQGVGEDQLKTQLENEYGVSLSESADGTGLIQQAFLSALADLMQREDENPASAAEVAPRMSSSEETPQDSINDLD